MQDHIDLSEEIYDLLKDGRQLSISGITRELKARNLNEHRLIVTGYLRAMHDLNCLNEFDLSPSKIYMLKNETEANTPSNSKKTEGDINEIYELVGGKFLKTTSLSIRLETTVYVFMTLFDRPCFESELNAAGIDSAQLFRYFNSKEANRLVVKSKIDHKKYDDIPKISKNSSAYEINTDRIDSDLLMRTINVLSSLLKDEIDVAELVSKAANKSLLDF